MEDHDYIETINEDAERKSIPESKPQFEEPRPERVRVDNDDFVKYIDEDGNLVREHEPTGNKYIQRPDGTQEVPALHTDEQLHGEDVSDHLGEKDISPDVSDVGQAVMNAISELGDTGGIIKLPRGLVNSDTAIDLSTGVAVSDVTTPIIIEGHGNDGRQGGDAQFGTVIDSRGLTDHTIKVLTNTENITLRDFSIFGDYGSGAGIYNDPDSYVRNGVIENVTVTGSLGWGTDIAQWYGGKLENVYAQGTQRGHNWELINATSVKNPKARACTDSSNPAVVIQNSKGSPFDGFYLESNHGPALETIGVKLPMEGFYFENNLRSTSDTTEVVLDGSRCSLQAWHFAASSSATDRVSFGLVNSTVESLEFIEGGITAAGSSAWRNTFISNHIGGVDFSGVNVGNTWIENNIFTSNNTKSSSATLVSGQ